MLRLLDTARQIGPTDCNVLVSGESGTGKELFARYVHAHSSRSESRFVAVNCGALQEELLANEENSLPTHHPKIMVSKVRPNSFDETSSAVAELKDALSSGDDYRLVALLKKFIPEYLSNNSRFAHLDKEPLSRPLNVQQNL
jgi:hypothetical protein